MARFKNTSGIPDEKVHQVLSFVRPVGLGAIDVNVSRSSGAYAGKAYMEGHSLHGNARPFIIVRVGDVSRFPMKPRVEAGRGYLDMGFLYNRIEALVMVAAHELRHQWQKNHKRGRVWGTRGQYSERDADAYALRKLREWRRANGIYREVR